MNGEQVRPVLGRNVYVAPTAWVCGAVTIGDDVTIMHHVAVRGDVSRIAIGARVNLQDGTVVHTKTGVDLTIEDDVAVGHRAIVHCTRVGGHTLIGMGAIVLDECVIGRDCVIGAGALLAPGTVVPDGKVVVGVPGRVVRDVTQRDMEYLDFVLNNYLRLGREHAAGRYPNVTR
jgi:carbonic anhydrase/acetyltransferase-like protein (isoleucine patch superfamily)